MLDLAKLNDQQLAAVKHDTGPLLVIAGAGTGKTQVISYRIAYLIEKLKVKPEQILAITFTDKAAREMETRVSELLGRYVLDVKIATFNAYGDGLLRRFAYELGYSQKLRLLSETQQTVFLTENLDALKLRYYSPITNPEGFIAELAKYFSKLASELVTPAKYTKFTLYESKNAKDQAAKLEAARHAELAYAYQAYQTLKRKNNLIDFDDQVNLAIELLEKFANIKAKITSENRYILVDEFQDTNTAQSRLIDLLVANPLAAGQNVMVVGDDDQSIYRFRGASVSNILSFGDRYKKAKRIALTQNYRSSQAILDSAYRLIQFNNPERLEAKYGIDKRLRAQFKGVKPSLKTFLTYDEEASWVASDIAQKLKSGEEPGSIAILLRKNTQSRILAKHLEAAAVDFMVIGQTEDLYRQTVVKLLINFLKVVADPRDSVSLYHLLSSELYDFEPSWLTEQAAIARRQHVPLESLLKEAESMAAFFTQLAAWRELLPSLAVGSLCFRFLEDSGYLKQLVKGMRTSPELAEPIDHLNQFFKTLADFQAVSHDDTTLGYLKALPSLAGSGERLAIEDLPEVFGDKVRLLTVHKAKGLEFETVYLFDMTQDTFPARNVGSSLEIPEALLEAKDIAAETQSAEERRLMYVAMTRAKRSLTLTYSADHGGKQAKKPSIFIEQALGEQPALAGLKPKLVNTDQIELFRPKTNLKKSGLSLPPSLQVGERLFLTARQIEDYLMCPAEFYLRHVMAPPQEANFALEYGNLLHAVIQLYNRRQLDGKKAKREDLTAYIDANWPKESFISVGHKRRSLAQAKQTVAKFYKRESAAKRYPNLIEQPFEIELKQCAVNIRGRFDAVYEEVAEPSNPVRNKPPQGGSSRAFGRAVSNGVEIRDYKTGAANVTDQAKADKRAKESLQLGIYALAWQNLKGRLPDVLSLDFIDVGLVGRASKTPRQLAAVENKIKQVTEGVRAGDFSPQGTHIFCTHMDYGF